MFKMLQLVYVGFLARALGKARTHDKTHDLGKRGGGEEDIRSTCWPINGASLECHSLWPACSSRGVPSPVACLLITRVAAARCW